MKPVFMYYKFTKHRAVVVVVVALRNARQELLVGLFPSFCPLKPQTGLRIIFQETRDGCCLNNGFCRLLARALAKLAALSIIIKPRQVKKPTDEERASRNAAL